MEYLESYASDLYDFIKEQFPEMNADTFVKTPAEGGNPDSCIITGRIGEKVFLIKLVQNFISFYADYEKDEDLFNKMFSCIKFFVGPELSSCYWDNSEEKKSEEFTIVLEHRLDLGVVRRTV